MKVLRIINFQCIAIKESKSYAEYRIFDVDYDMTVAWERLNQGKPLERDIVLLNHELLESKYEKIYNHDISHSLANQKYNWEEQLYR